MNPTNAGAAGPGGPGQHKAPAGPGSGEEGGGVREKTRIVAISQQEISPQLHFSYKADTKPALGFKRWGQRRPAEALKKTACATDDSC